MASSLVEQLTCLPERPVEAIAETRSGPLVSIA